MKRSLVVVLVASALAACASQRPAPEAPASTAPAQQPGSAPQGYPQQSGAYPSPPPPSATVPAEPVTPQRQASAELESAQRELDVAAGDCHNACRALSSMDRAAGRLCGLSSGNDDDTQRCKTAKERVYSARDKVKSSCGQCPETSVDRNAPVPSR